MSYKIDVSNIIGDHLRTLVNSDTNKPDMRDWFFFLIIPLMLSGYLVYLGYCINDNLSNSLIAGLSIYVGLSINFLMLIFELSTKEFFKALQRKAIIKQIIANISVTAIYSLLLIILTIMAPISKDYFFFSKGLHFSLYFFLFEFIFTLLMVLKRIYQVLQGTVDI